MGPAGLGAALWAARYQRSVVLIDLGQQRNRSVEKTHGYLFVDSVSPERMLEKGREEVRRYPEVDLRLGARVVDVGLTNGAFNLTLDSGDAVLALRLVLATGVRDILPEITGFDECYGTSVFTCPSCDGYEAKDTDVVVIGVDESMGPLAVGLLDWARSVTVLDPQESDARGVDHARLRDSGVHVVAGKPASFNIEGGQLRGVCLESGIEVRCQRVFCAVDHVQNSSIARDLGCKISDAGCVVVDERGATNVKHVYAVGDMTPGPQLVQVAAAEGAVAGISAALSLRGYLGAPGSPTPAPDPAGV